MTSVLKIKESINIVKVIEDSPGVIRIVSQGPQGIPGQDGMDGLPGSDGFDGLDGKSAYELAVDNGFSGTEQEWLDSLGIPGPANTLSVGTYELVSSDAPLEIEIVGDAPEQTINFKIPSGQNGQALALPAGVYQISQMPTIHKQKYASLVAATRAPAPVTVTDSNNTCTISLKVEGFVIMSLPLTFPAGTYRDGIMAALALDTSGLPIRFTGSEGKVSIDLLASVTNGAELEFTSGTATWLGFTSGQSTAVSINETISTSTALEQRVQSLELGGGSGGSGTVSIGGPSCVYASITATPVSGNLGYQAGSPGYAAISPLFIDQELSFSKMMFEIWTTYIASATYTAILYDSASGYPSTLLARADIATGTSGGIKSSAITPITLTPGNYWIGAWIGEVEPATGALVCNTGIGVMQAYSASGNGKSGNQRIAAGWKTNNYALGAVGSSWPSRTAIGMDSDYRVPRVGLWAG